MKSVVYVRVLWELQIALLGRIWWLREGIWIDLRCMVDIKFWLPIDQVVFIKRIISKCDLFFSDIITPCSKGFWLKWRDANVKLVCQHFIIINVSGCWEILKWNLSYHRDWVYLCTRYILAVWVISVLLHVQARVYHEAVRLTLSFKVSLRSTQQIHCCTSHIGTVKAFQLI